jgi:hypothetical protein
MSKVTVGCKLPHGLVAKVGDKSVTFNGTNTTDLIGGHGITHDVDQAFWDAWLEQNKGLAFVRNGFVFADAKPASVTAQAKEKTNEKTGLEPLDPNKKPAGITDADK